MSLGSNKQQQILGNAAVTTNAWVQTQSVNQNYSTVLAGVNTNGTIYTAQNFSNNTTVAFANVASNGLYSGSFRQLDGNIKTVPYLQSDSTGNVYVTGTVGTTANAWVAKMDANMNTIYWQNKYSAGSSGILTFPSALPNINGTQVLLYGVIGVGSSGGYAASIWTANGTVKWASSVTDNGNNYPLDAMWDSTGNVYLALGGVNTTFGSIIKLDSTGAKVWGNVITQTVGGTTKNSIPNNMINDSSGALYLATYSGGWPNSANILTSVTSLTTNGVQNWATNLWNVGPSKLGIDVTGNIYLNGNDSSPGIGYVTKFNKTSGNVMFGKNFTGTTNFANVKTTVGIASYGTPYNFLLTSATLNQQSAIISIPADNNMAPANVAFPGNATVISIGNVTMTSNTASLSITSNALVQQATITVTPTTTTYAYANTAPYYINNFYFTGTANPYIPPTPVTPTYNWMFNAAGAQGSGDSNLTTNTYIYDLGTGAYTAEGAVGTAVLNAGGFGDQTYGFFVGGYNNSTNVTQNNKYTNANGTTMNKTNASTSSPFATQNGWRGSAYATGGRGYLWGGTFTGAVLKYNISGDSWTSGTSLPQSIGWQAAHNNGTYAIISGGYNSSSDLNTNYILTFASDTSYATGTTLAVATRDTSSTGDQTYAYLYCGTASGSVTSTIRKLAIATGTQSTTFTNSSALRFGEAAGSDTKGVFIGGQTNLSPGNATNLTRECLYATDTFSTGTNYGINISEACAWSGAQTS
jgi:hypothetical protein